MADDIQATDATDEVELSDEDIRQISSALDDAQTRWERVGYLSAQKMPCPECGGAGQIAGGSLGDICPGCLGARVIDHPAAEQLVLPPFASMRAALSAYANARLDRALPDGHRGKKGLALPPRSTVPTLEEIQNLGAEALEKAKALPPVTMPALAEPERKRGMLGDGGIAGNWSEDDLDQFDDFETYASKQERKE